MIKIKNSHLQDDKTTNIISWGHWFTLFNIILVISLGSQYLTIADWPRTFFGRFYAIISAIGHFSFITFAIYIILLFPLSFIIRSIKWQRIIATIIATLGITLLLIDIEVFSHFRMHLNVSIWKVLISDDNSFLNHAFILVPIILLLEIFFAIWSWKKLRVLYKRRRFGQVTVIICFICFIASHLIHIWADANFYRPITMQRSSLPLSYPLTARHFLEHYGFIDNYRSRLRQEGNPSAIAIEYPLNRIEFEAKTNSANIVLIVIDGFNDKVLDLMPSLSEFASQNIQFANHYAASNQAYLNDFSLFYGLDPNYYHSILASHTPSVMLNVIEKEKYNLGLFSAEGFIKPLYRNAILSNFSIPDSEKNSNTQTTIDWINWYPKKQTDKIRSPLFSMIHYSLYDENNLLSFKELQTKSKKLDQDIASVVEKLKSLNELDNTVVIITGTNNFNIDANKKIALPINNTSFNREWLKVPLIVAWPGKSAVVMDKVTSQTDIMTTLMQDVLNVTSPIQNYSQGKNLFLPNSRNWIIAGDEKKIAALYADETVVIDDFGTSKIYNLNDTLAKHKTLSLPLFLQIINENRRFMVIDN